jgi:hypothetical protein
MNICPEMSGFYFSTKITFKNKYLNYVTFTYKRHFTFTVHLPYFIIVELCTVYQITVHNKCLKCSPPESIHTWTQLTMDVSTFSKVPGALRIV